MKFRKRILWFILFSAGLVLLSSPLYTNSISQPQEIEAFDPAPKIDTPSLNFALPLPTCAPAQADLSPPLNRPMTLTTIRNFTLSATGSSRTRIPIGTPPSTQKKPCNGRWRNIGSSPKNPVASSSSRRSACPLVARSDCPRRITMNTTVSWQKRTSGLYISRDLTSHRRITTLWSRSGEFSVPTKARSC